MSRFPEHVPADIEVREVDLDSEEVRFRGERLSEARAKSIADEILKRTHHGQPPPESAE